MPNSEVLLTFQTSPPGLPVNRSVMQSSSEPWVVPSSCGRHPHPVRRCQRGGDLGVSGCRGDSLLQKPPHISVSFPLLFG